jgi:hypothetical protein
MDEVTLMELLQKQELDPAERQVFEQYKNPRMLDMLQQDYFFPYRERVGLAEAPDRKLSSPHAYAQKVLELLGIKQ